MIIAPFTRRTIEHALHAGPTLVEAAREAGAACFAASLVEGPAVLLGAHQRPARVLDMAAVRMAGVPVFRRRTAGTCAFAAGRALVFTLALPHVTALFPDASFRTLLNRHVRPLLRGLTAAGALSHYFGREWVSSHRRPVLLLGFDVEPDGAVLIEAIGGFDGSFGLPASLAAEDERALDRFGDRAPAALCELLPEGTTPESVARCVTDAMGARSPAPVTVREGLLPGVADGAAFVVDLSSSEPVPPGASLLAPARIPIGWLERARCGDGGLWLGGDVLAPRWWLDRVAATATATATATGTAGNDVYTIDPPLDGVSLQELVEKATLGTA